EDALAPPGAGSCTASREMSGPACSERWQLPPPLGQSFKSAATIGARSGSGGLLQETAKSLLDRQSSPPSRLVSTLLGAVLSIRAVTGTDAPTLPAVSCA